MQQPSNHRWPGAPRKGPPPSVPQQGPILKGAARKVDSPLCRPGLGGGHTSDRAMRRAPGAEPSRPARASRAELAQAEAPRSLPAAVDRAGCSSDLSTSAGQGVRRPVWQVWWCCLGLAELSLPQGCKPAG